MRDRSHASDHWQSFPKGPHTFFQEGFVHDKKLNFKAKMQNENDGVIIKETIIEKTEGLSGAGEIEMWITADTKRTCSAKIGTNTNLNLQFDNGVRPLKRISQNLYAGFEVNRSFTEKICRVGLQLFKDDIWSIDNRFVYNFSRSGLTWDGKGYFSWRSWKLNALSSVEMGNKAALGQLGLLLRWSQSPKDTLYIKLERKGCNQTPIRALTEGLIFGWNSAVSNTHTVGIETRINVSGLSWKHPLRNLQPVWLGSQWQFDGTKVKVNVRSDLSHAITVTNKLGSYGEYSLGMEVTEVGSKNKYRFGTQVSLNL